MKYFAEVGDQEFEFQFERVEDRLYAVTPDGKRREVDLSLVGDGKAFALLVDGKSHDILVDRDEQGTVVQVAGERLRVHLEDERERAARAVAGAKASGRREIRAVMPGVVVEVFVTENQEVAEGETLVVLEAMKMQNPLQSDAPGTVLRVLVEQGQTVAGGDLLVVVESE